MKGKIFNAQEVQSILNGSKVMFREIAKIKLSIASYNFDTKQFYDDPIFKKCPYQVGQKIFVKEKFARSFDSEGNPIAILKADSKEEGKWRPAQQMKQEHSRITLEITDVKVERLGEISEDDCKKEGIGYTGGWNGEDYDNGEFYFGKLQETKDGMNWKNEMFEYPDLAFAELWNATHKKSEEKFEVNPFVWVVDFKINK